MAPWPQFLLFLTLFSSSFVFSTNGLSCDTVDTDPDIPPDSAEAMIYIISKPKWPNGVVKYHLSDSVFSNLEQLVKSAFKEYHTKTCVRFEEKSSSDINYVSIEYEQDDKKVSGGLADVCMKGGYQYLKIGPGGQSLETVIHELGHTLCLSHEHQRKDRDNYIKVDMKNDNCRNQHFDVKHRPVHGLYNYASQMHYSCDACISPINKNVPGCGEKVTEGLSVLDADYINELYECQGCHAHRWRTIESLKDEGKPSSVYPCRASVYGNILVGTYKSNICAVLDNDGVLNYTDNFEILYVPSQFKYHYISLDQDTVPLAEWRDYFTYAVPGGFRLFESKLKYQTVFVGQATVDRGHGQIETVFGSVWMDKTGIQSSFGVNGTSKKFASYRILGCYPDGPSKSSYISENNGNSNFLKPLNENLSSRAIITIIAKFRPNFQIFLMQGNEITCQFDFNTNSIEYKVRRTTGDFQKYETVSYDKLISDKLFKLVIAFEKRTITVYIDNVAVSNEKLHENLIAAKYLWIQNLNVTHVDIRYKETPENQNYTGGQHSEYNIVNPEKVFYNLAGKSKTDAKVIYHLTVGDINVIYIRLDYFIGVVGAVLVTSFLVLLILWKCASFRTNKAYKPVLPGYR